MEHYEFIVLLTPCLTFLIVAFVCLILRIFTRFGFTRDTILANQQSPLICISICSAVTSFGPHIFVTFPILTANHGLVWVWSLVGYFSSNLVGYYVVMPIFYYVHQATISGYIEKRFAVRSTKNLAVLLRLFTAIISTMISLGYLVWLLLVLMSFVRQTFMETYLIWMVAFGVVIIVISAVGGHFCFVLFSPIIYCLLLLAAGVLVISSLPVFTEYKLSWFNNSTNNYSDKNLFNVLNFGDILTLRRLDPVTAIAGSFVIFLYLASCDQFSNQSIGGCLTMQKARLSYLLNLLFSSILLISAVPVSIVINSGFAKANCSESSLAASSIVVQIIQTVQINSNYSVLIFVKLLITTAGINAFIFSASHRLHTISILLCDDWLKICCICKSARAGLEKSKNMGYFVAAILVGSFLIFLVISIHLLSSNVDLVYMNFIKYLISVTGPLVGLMILSTLFPCTNAQGVIIGLAAGCLSTGTITAWSIYSGNHGILPEFPVARRCAVTNDLEKSMILKAVSIAEGMDVSKITFNPTLPTVRHVNVKSPTKSSSEATRASSFTTFATTLGVPKPTLTTTVKAMETNISSPIDSSILSTQHLTKMTLSTTAAASASSTPTPTILISPNKKRIQKFRFQEETNQSFSPPSNTSKIPDPIKDFTPPEYENVNFSLSTASLIATPTTFPASPASPTLAIPIDGNETFESSNETHPFDTNSKNHESKSGIRKSDEILIDNENQHKLKSDQVPSNPALTDPSLDNVLVSVDYPNYDYYEDDYFSNYHANQTIIYDYLKPNNSLIEIDQLIFETNGSFVNREFIPIASNLISPIASQPPINSSMHPYYVNEPLAKLWMYSPLIGAIVTIVFGLIFSFLAGGNNIYALDWNLVHWTCSSATDATYRKPWSRKNRKLKSKPEYVLCRQVNESFRAGNNLPDTHYSNMRLFQSLQRESNL